MIGHDLLGSQCWPPRRRHVAGPHCRRAKSARHFPCIPAHTTIRWAGSNRWPRLGSRAGTGPDLACRQFTAWCRRSRITCWLRSIALREARNRGCRTIVRGRRCPPFRCRRIVRCHHRSNPKTKTGCDVIISVQDLAVHFPVAAACWAAVAVAARGRGFLSIRMKRGGGSASSAKSGSGKSTVALSILGLQATTHGSIVTGRAGGAGRQSASGSAGPHRANGFRNPYASLQSAPDRSPHAGRPMRLHGVTEKSEIDGT